MYNFPLKKCVTGYYVLFPTRRLHATCSELPRNHIISMLRVVFNGCAEVPSKLREVFLLGFDV